VSAEARQREGMLEDGREIEEAGPSACRWKRGELRGLWQERERRCRRPCRQGSGRSSGGQRALVELARRDLISSKIVRRGLGLRGHGVKRAARMFALNHPEQILQGALW